MSMREALRLKGFANPHVIDAGTLTGGSNLAATTDLLPFLYKGSLTVTGNQVAVDVARKSAAELGLDQVRKRRLRRHLRGAG